MIEFLEIDELVEKIEDGSTLYSAAFGLAGFPEEAAIAIEKSFLETGSPKNLTYYNGAASGAFKERGAAHLAHEGLLKRIVTGHFGGIGPKLQKLIMENKIEAYNFPQGVLSILPRYIAGRRPGLLTKVGLNTFADPRIEGGKSNELTTEDLVEVVNFDGEEWLYYKKPKVDYAFVRGNVADENGNVIMNKDGILTEALSVVEAAKACGGKVIVEVEKIAKAGSLHPKEVKIPGIMVDYVVQSKPEHHYQTMGTYYDPRYSGDLKVPVDKDFSMEMSERKIIARRAAMELQPDVVVNLGVGIPDGVATIAAEEGVSELMKMSIESGSVGGVPATGLDFSHTINAEAIIEQPYQFDFYDGGGIDISFIGMGETDASGNVNVSKLNGKPVGCGGAVNITQNAKSMVFCGTFTAGGLELEITPDQKLKIVNEGKHQKFVESVEQITFSGEYANSIDQPVYYVTERAVFELTKQGLELKEIAPGIDLEKDVLNQMGFVPIMNDVKEMNPDIFAETWGRLAEHLGVK